MTLQGLRTGMSASWWKFSPLSQNVRAPPKSQTNSTLFGEWYRFDSRSQSLTWRYRFCFIPNVARPLLDLEIRFFNEARTRNGLDAHFLFFCCLTLFLTVPVVAIFTKFDDLITQVYNDEVDEQGNRRVAENELEKKFRKPLYGFKFPPKAHVRMEGTYDGGTDLLFIDPILLLDLQDHNSNHQGQVKVLLTKTTDSLNDIVLKILFVLVQQNDLELSLTYAVKQYAFNLQYC